MGAVPTKFSNEFKCMVYCYNSTGDATSTSWADGPYKQLNHALRVKNVDG